MISSTANASKEGGFQWRANNDREAPYNPGEGGLFSTSAATPGKIIPVSFSPTSTTTTTTTAGGGLSTVGARPGDDPSPPNAVDARLLNAIAVPVSSSGGWSKHAPRQRVYPSKIDYLIQLDTNDSLEMKVALEYYNPNAIYNESMMVSVSIAKAWLCEEKQGDSSTSTNDEGELNLVSTKFQDYSSDREEWIDITADVDYSRTADEVVEAVLSDPNCGQTAGQASSTEEQVNVTLGPFSSHGRIILTYKAEKAYTYQAMSVTTDGSDIGSKRLCPLMVALPFTKLGHEAGLAACSVALSAPAGTEILSMDTFRDAYYHLKQSELMKSTTLIAVTDLVSQPDGRAGYKFQMNSLPPRSCGLLSWFVLPNQEASEPGYDFVDLGEGSHQQGSTRSGQDGIQAIIQQPSAYDDPCLKVPLPGHGPVGNLLRVKLTMPKAKPRTVPYFILNLALSDKSASTSIVCLSFGQQRQQATVRHRFNELAVARFLKRLESIPALVQAGVLLRDDIWMDAFLPFNGEAPKSKIVRSTFRVGDVVDSIGAVVAAIRADDQRNGNTLNYHDPNRTRAGSPATTAMPFVKRHIDAIRSVTPDGGTDFMVAPTTIVEAYKEWETEVKSRLPAIDDSARCTFVEFDTDGGHGASMFPGYVSALQTLCSECHVRSGVVTGFGTWLNQHHATTVAETLGNVPAQLALHIPEPGAEGLDLIFRRCFAAWVNSLRKPPPVNIKISAGSVSFPNSATSTRTVNAMEVLAIRQYSRTGAKGRGANSKLPSFGPPDVSDEQFTATQLQNVTAEDQLLIYIVSRMESVPDLAAALNISSPPARTTSNSDSTQTMASINVESETLTGDFLAYDWLRMLTATNVFGKSRYHLAPLIQSTSLRPRFEDEVAFRFNIPSPSGMTSFLGRCKTVANRASIDKDHRPSPPLPPVKYPALSFGVAVNTCGASQVGAFGAPASFGFSNPSHAFGAPAGFGSSPTPPAPSGAPLGGSLFGCMSAPAGFGSPASAPFGSPGPATCGGSTLPLPSSGLFGSPAPPPSSGFFGSPAPPPSSSLFGSPAPPPLSGSFGSPVPLPSSRFFGSPAPKILEEPRWAYAMKIPAGFNEPQLRNEMKDLLPGVWLACQAMVKDHSVNFFCDLCRKNISEGEHRFHCFDCDGFDMCFGCKDGHKEPLHRVALVQPAVEKQSQSNPISTNEDPLISSLLKSSTISLAGTTQASTSSPLPEDDRWVIVSKLQVMHFLLTILHWWPVYRSMCTSCHQLPVDMPDEMLGKLTRSTNGGSTSDLFEVGKIIIESVMREETKTP